MTIIESLKKYFEQNAPDINVLGVDFLGDKIGNMVIEAIPCDPIIAEYLDGSTERQFLFVIGGREFYSPDICQNIENSQIYENLQMWLESQSRNGKLPELSESRQAHSLEITSSAYVLESDELNSNARYQIQCKLTYYQEAY